MYSCIIISSNRVFLFSELTSPFLPTTVHSVDGAEGGGDARGSRTVRRTGLPPGVRRPETPAYDGLQALDAAHEGESPAGTLFHMVKCVNVKLK